MKSNVASVDDIDIANPFLDLLNDKFPPFRPERSALESSSKGAQEDARW